MITIQNLQLCQLLMTLDDPISVHDVVNVFIAAEISWGRSEAERHILSLQAQVVLKEEIIYKL